MKAAIYTRVSSEMQTDGHSLDAQLSACRRLCADRGWAIVTEYTDVESARTTVRPQFQQMLIDAEWGQFDVIVVHKLDRFARDRYDSARYRHKLKKNGVRLVSVLENLDDSPESVIMLSRF